MEATTAVLRVDAIIFRSDLYPRLETNAQMVQKYAEDLSVLPPIEVNQNNELIDGWHRWTAHKKKGVEKIEVAVTETSSDTHLLELAIERNAKFGQQLSNRDKKRVAARIYHDTPSEERGEKKRHLADILSVSYDTVNRWLSRIDKDDEEERNSAILNLYLQCYTQEEIAEAVFGELTDATKKTVSRVWDEIRKYKICPIPGQFTDDQPEDSATDKVKKEWEEQRQQQIVSYNIECADHSFDFSRPIYNVWKQQEKSEASEHFGNSEPSFVDRLLYLYTQPFDIVVDPFAGGGSTLDVCRNRFRRCWLSDRKPIEDRIKDIRRLDLTESMPDLRKRWADVKLVYLDPPYWKQAEGQYSDDPSDLANMDIDTFTATLSGIIKSFAKKLTDAYIALIIQPTQWNAPERQFTDHIGDMLRCVDLPVDMRYSVPYESQQCNAQMVDWAKSNRRCLVLTREIIVWRTEPNDSGCKGQKGRSVQ